MNCTIIDLLAQSLALASVISYDHYVMLQIMAFLTGNSKGVIYNRNVFIIQASGVDVKTLSKNELFCLRLPFEKRSLVC
jgi:general stress protein CsbA